MGQNSFCSLSTNYGITLPITDSSPVIDNFRSFSNPFLFAIFSGFFTQYSAMSSAISTFLTSQILFQFLVSNNVLIDSFVTNHKTIYQYIIRHKKLKKY